MAASNCCKNKSKSHVFKYNYYNSFVNKVEIINLNPPTSNSSSSSSSTSSSQNSPIHKINIERDNYSALKQGSKYLNTSSEAAVSARIAKQLSKMSAAALDNNNNDSTTGTTAAHTNGNLLTFVDPNKVHLFVKAGQDGRSQGACPFCQDVFMQLLIKAEDNKFNFDVITINLDNPPKEFKELSIKPPVLFHGNQLNKSAAVVDQHDSQIILSDVDEIAEYLDHAYPNLKLLVNDAEAKNAFLNVFSKFSHYIRDVATQASLEAELEKINNYLKKSNENGNKFLCGNYLTKLDCSLLPRLQHIRVGAEHIKQFKIPEKFTHLWKYMDNAYKTEVFQKSCPPDREIIWHWTKTNQQKANIKQLLLEEVPFKTLEIPKNIKV